jgi:hypothetical protein
MATAVLGFGRSAPGWAAQGVSSPFWPSLIAQGSVSVGYRWDIDAIGEVTNRAGRVLTRVGFSDSLERLVASGDHVMWIVSRLIDPGSGDTSDQVVLGDLHGPLRPRVVGSCLNGIAVGALSSSTVAYGCSAAYDPADLAVVSMRTVHVSNLATGAAATVAMDGPPLEIAMSSRYMAVAIDITAAATSSLRAAKEIELVDLRSMQVVSRITAADWIQSMAVSSTGTIAMIQGPTPAPLDQLRGSRSEFDFAYGGDSCPGRGSLVTVPLGGAARTVDDSACPYPLAAASSGFVYPRVQGRGAELVDTDAAGHRTLLQRLGRARGLLTLDQVATDGTTVLYTEGTCRASGGPIGVSAYTQSVLQHSATLAAPPVGCPVTGRLPGHVGFPSGRSPKVFTVSIACPRGCARVTVTLDLPHSDDAGAAGGGTLAGVMPRRHATIKVTCNYMCSGANRPRSLFATIKSPDRTGTDVVYARRTIRITY